MGYGATKRLSGWLFPHRHGTSRPGPLRVQVGDQTLSFKNLREFDFCLAGRTGVPPLRVFELMDRSAAELANESTQLRQYEARLAGIIEDFDRHGLSCTEALARLGATSVSKDFEWRALMTALISQQRAADPYLRVALARYLQYVGARQEVLRSLYDSKTGADRCELDAGEQVPAHARATVCFEAKSAVALSANTNLQRLPQGEPVTLELAPGASLALKLARHDFALTHAREWELIADDGQRFVLREGVNSVGRARDNDIALGAGFRNVSRRHLLAQPLGRDAIALTDLSSYGTYIAAL